MESAALREEGGAGGRFVGQPKGLPQGEQLVLKLGFQHLRKEQMSENGRTGCSSFKERLQYTDAFRNASGAPG
jgi:hypothetical protein